MREPFAFFDFDGTLSPLRTMVSFELARCRSGSSGLLRRFVLMHVYPRLPRSLANRDYYRRFRGRTAQEVENAVRYWFANLQASGCKIFHAGPVCQLRNLQAAGVNPVFVSGSTHEILRPFAEALGVTRILATTLEHRFGVYTGRISPPQMIGLGKRVAVEQFLAEHNTRSSECYAFGDHKSDIPLLESVGRPCVVVGDSMLEKHAQTRGWPIIPAD